MNKKNITIIVFLILIAALTCVIYLKYLTKPEDKSAESKNAITSEKIDAEETEVNLFFANKKYVDTGDESVEKVLPVKKKISLRGTNLETAIVKELFNDPSVEGVATELTGDIKIIGVEVKDKCAYVNFSGEGLHGGTLQEELIVEQVTKSLLNLDSVESVRFLKDGENTDSLMEQVDVSEPFYESKNINSSELRFGEVFLGLNEDELINKIGKPTETIEESDTGIISLNYDGFNVVVKNSKVIKVSISTDKYSLPSGVKIGDSKDTIMKTYGQPYSLGKGWMNYSVKLEKSQDSYLKEILSFKIVNEKVTNMIIKYE